MPTSPETITTPQETQRIEVQLYTRKNQLEEDLSMLTQANNLRKQTALKQLRTALPDPEDQINPTAALTGTFALTDALLKTLFKADSFNITQIHKSHLSALFTAALSIETEVTQHLCENKTLQDFEHRFDLDPHTRNALIHVATAAADSTIEEQSIIGDRALINIAPGLHLIYQPQPVSTQEPVTLVGWHPLEKFQRQNELGSKIQAKFPDH